MLGARKSRYSGREVAATVALLKARVGCCMPRFVPRTPFLDAVLLTARRHDAHMFDVVAIANVVCVKVGVGGSVIAGTSDKHVKMRPTAGAF